MNTRMYILLTLLSFPATLLAMTGKGPDLVMFGGAGIAAYLVATQVATQAEKPIHTFGMWALLLLVGAIFFCGFIFLCLAAWKIV